MTPPEIYSIIHPENYIKFSTSNGRLVRNVYHNVPFDQFEESKIEELQNLMIRDLPSDWDKILSLKYLYATQFKVSDAAEMIKQHLEWRVNPEFQALDKNAEELLKNGVIYTLGRDKEYRPIIYFQISQMSTDISKQTTIYKALCVLLNTIRDTMLVPYHVEKWRIVLDLQNVKVFSLPLQIIKHIIDITQVNYTSSLHQLHICNPPYMLSAVWKVIEKLMHPETAKKIKFCDEVESLHEFVNQDQLQQKYKGTLPNFNRFWPIQNTFHQDQASMKKMEESANIYHSFSEYHTVNSSVELSIPIKNQACCSIF